MNSKTNKIAVIRVRGSVRLNYKIKDTLNLLRLYRKNFCVVLENTPSLQGMLKKVKDYVTYGEIDDSIYNELVIRKGEEFRGREQDRKGRIKYSNKFIVINNKKLKPFFRLNPPRKGFGRKGIKVSFKSHGALGYRAEKINDLIKRMI